MIPVHNCASLLAEALPEVVAQLGKRDDVQIEVIDDGSADEPFRVVERLGEGVVSYHRVDSPSGAVPNFNRCLRLSRGRFVHLLHGDDAVLPGFYAAMEDALSDPTFVAALCRTTYIDDRGHPLRTTRSERRGTGPWDSALRTLAVSNRVRPPGIVVRRAAYESIGGFREDLPHAADWEMWTRLAAAGRITFVDTPLAQYRVHAGSDTSARVRSGVNIDERLDTIEIVANALPPDERQRSARKAYLYSAGFALRTAARGLLRRDLPTTSAQTRAAARCVARALTRRACSQAG